MDYYLRKEVEKFFAERDRDFDGRLSLEEFLGEETQIEKLFRLMDKNKDGFVTKKVRNWESFQKIKKFGDISMHKTFYSFAQKRVLMKSFPSIDCTTLLMNYSLTKPKYPLYPPLLSKILCASHKMLTFRSLWQSAQSFRRSRCDTDPAKLIS